MVPTLVQPLKPLSKPPLVIPPPPVAVTVTATVVECVAVPSVPVTVTVYEPAATAEPTLTVKVELPPAVTDVGLSDAVGPAGLTLALRFTVPGVPMAVVLMVLVPLLPCAMLSELGEALIEKSLVTGGETVTVTVVLCVVVPSVPVTVTV